MDPDAWKQKMTLPLILTLIGSFILGIWGGIILLILLILYFAVLKTPKNDAEVKGAIVGGIIGIVLGYVIAVVLAMALITSFY